MNSNYGTIICIHVYIYIYIYIYWQHFFNNTNFVEHNKHFLYTYYLLDSFVLSYCFYRIYIYIYIYKCIYIYIYMC